MDGDSGDTMEQTLDHRAASDPFGHVDPVHDDEVVEFTTHIRERPVTCHWAEGRVTGDPELMQRLSQTIVATGWTDHPASVAKAISEAVANPVTIRIVAHHQVDPDGHVPAPPCPDPGRAYDVLGDYWLG
jgi:hypothetical protein